MFWQNTCHVYKRLWYKVSWTKKLSWIHTKQSIFATDESIKQFLIEEVQFKNSFKWPHNVRINFIHMDVLLFVKGIDSLTSQRLTVWIYSFISSTVGKRSIEHKVFFSRNISSKAVKWNYTLDVGSNPRKSKCISSYITLYVIKRNDREIRWTGEEQKVQTGRENRKTLRYDSIYCTM